MHVLGMWEGSPRKRAMLGDANSPQEGKIQTQAGILEQKGRTCSTLDHHAAYSWGVFL